MAKSRFSWKATAAEARYQNDKEDREALQKYGLSTSVKHEADGSIEYTISGDEETVSKWRRIIGG